MFCKSIFCGHWTEPYAIAFRPRNMYIKECKFVLLKLEVVRLFEYSSHITYMQFSTNLDEYVVF